MTGIMEAHAQGARGHVDCREIIKDRAIGRAIPIVLVTNPLAKVTHEAAIGTVDKKGAANLNGAWSRSGAGHGTHCQRHAAIALSVWDLCHSILE